MRIIQSIFIHLHRPAPAGKARRAGSQITNTFPMPHCYSTQSFGRAASLACVVSTLIRVIALAQSPGTLDSSFSFTANARNPSQQGSEYCLSSSMLPDSKILMGGSYFYGAPAYAFHRLLTGGGADSSFQGSVDGRVVGCTAVQNDGQVLFSLSQLAAAPIFNGGGPVELFRRNADGNSGATSYQVAVDGTGTVLLVNPTINCLTVQPDGKILVGGLFTYFRQTYNASSGVSRNHLLRLNTDGTLDTGFNPDVGPPPTAEPYVRSMALQPDGKIVIGGQFLFVGQAAHQRLARVNADGSVDATFNPSADGAVLCVAVQPDGKILIGGMFASVNGVARNRVARLNADGTLDGTAFAGFNPNVNSSVFSLALQTDGKMLISGNFSSVGGVARNQIARLNSDGTLDTTFVSPWNASEASIYNITLQPDGRILAGGDFNTVGGVPSNKLARLLNGTGTQALSVTADQVEWLRGGASPETHHVTFESSADEGVMWTMLGAGTRISGGWEIAGLTLPSAGLVRARARTTGGIFNGSSGIVEKVRAFPASAEIAVEQPAGSNLLDGTASLDFGNVLQGAASSASFTIRNLGTLDLSVISFSVDGTAASDFFVNSTGTSANLASDGETTFSVTFAPTAPGARSAVLHIVSNDANESPFDIALTGTGLPPSPEIVVEQPVGTSLIDGSATVSMGSVGIGYSGSPVTITIRNTGTLDLTGVALMVDGTNASSYGINAAAMNTTIVPGGGTTFSVTFTPVGTGSGPRTASLHIASNDGDENPFDLNLSGTAVMPLPEITVEQPVGTDLADGSAFVSFSTSTWAGASKTFTIRNSGSGVLSGIVATLDGVNAADFLIEAPPLSIAPGGSAAFTVTFLPLAAGGARVATLRIASNDSNENPFDIGLSGLFAAPTIATEVTGGGAITIPSSGNASPYPSTLSVSGITGSIVSVRAKINGFSHTYPDDVDVFLMAPNGTVAAVFSDAGGSGDAVNANLDFSDSASTVVPDSSTITTGTYRPANYSPVEALPPGGTGTIGTNLTALAAAGANGQWKLFVSDDSGGDSGSIQSWGLVFEVPDVVSGPPEIAAFNGTSFVPSAELADNVGTLENGAIVAGSSAGAKTITIRNTGLSALTGLGISIDGANPADFGLSNLGMTSLAPGGSISFTVTFTPSASGARTANIHIASNDADENPFDIAVSGTGITAQEEWRQTYFGTTANTGNAADTFDFDKDGLMNLIEWAFGLDPTLGSSLQLPAGAVSGGSFVISFTRPAAVSGISYGAEWSSTLSSNAAEWTPITDTDPSATGYTFSVPASGNDRVFIRLIVTAP